MPDFHYNKFIKFAEKKYAQQNKLLLLDLVSVYRFDDVFTDFSVKKIKVYRKKGFPKKVSIKSKSEIPTMTCLLLLV